MKDHDIPRVRKSHFVYRLASTLFLLTNTSVTSATALLTTMIAGKSLLCGSLQQDIITRFENYFALFDGRNTFDTEHHTKVWQILNELFNDKILEGQLTLADEMLKRQTTVTVYRIEKCHTGRVFYHLKVSTAWDKRARHYVTGFATIDKHGHVVDVETRSNIVKARGQKSRQMACQ